MTPEEKAMLENTYALVKENNDILRSIRRTTRFATTMRILYWVLIIGLSFGAIYFIQPYIDMLKGVSGSAASQLNTDQGYADQIRDLLQ